MAADVTEEEEDEPKSFIPKKKDEYVSDVDGYYFIKFLEDQFKKKDLGGIFTRPNGKKYNSGYMKSVRDGKKGVTTDLYQAVQEFIPNFEQTFREFVDHVQNGYNQSNEEYQRDQAIEKKNQEKQKYIDLANDGTPAETNFCKFLVAVTGLNAAQIKDAMETDPNAKTVGPDGKPKIPKDMVQKAVDIFGISVNDFKAFRKTPGAYYPGIITNDKLDKVLKKYQVEVAQ